MGTISDLDKDEKKSFEREINKAVEILGSDDWYDTPTSALYSENLGICDKCKSLRAAKTLYGKLFARCWEFDENLSGKDPIIECTNYTKRGSLTLNSMKEMAHLIEIDKKQIGFIK